MCQQRAEHLKKYRKLGKFSKEEDIKILDAVTKYGKQWGLIAKKIGIGRNAKQVRERYAHLNDSQLNIDNYCDF